MTKPKHTPAQLEEISFWYRRIALVTTRYEFTAPVELADLNIVREQLADAVSADHRVRLALTPTGVLIEVFWPNGVRYYERTMLIY